MSVVTVLVAVKVRVTVCEGEGVGVGILVPSGIVVGVSFIVFVGGIIVKVGDGGIAVNVGVIVIVDVRV